jgi:hypothetical protein
MFFAGPATFTLTLGGVSATISPYDLIVSGISLLIIYFFAETSFRQAVALRNLRE